MKSKLLYILFLLILTLAPVEMVCAEVDENNELVTAADGMQYTQEQMDSLRMTDDFVRASLVVTDPGEVLYSMLGHACLHMECPSFGLDYIYSYESEAVEDKVLRFLRGDLKMGMYPIETEEFLLPYREEGREVREFLLSLTPSQESKLWEILDKHVGEGVELQYDYSKRGCARTIVNVMHEALGKTCIAYVPWSDKYKNNTFRELGQMAITKAKNEHLISEKSAYWNTVFMYALIGDDWDKNYPCEKKLIVPNDLVEVWQQAKVDGRYLLSQECKILAERQVTEKASCVITPVIVAIILLLFAVIGFLTEWKWLDGIVLIVVTMIGSLMTYLWVFSTLPCTSWSWLIIPFNILPAVGWYWRRYWAIPYAGVILLWVIGMICWPHKIVDMSYLILSVAFIITLLAQRKDILTHIKTKGEKDETNC